MIKLFICLATQWKRAGLSGIRVGLDYAAIAPAAQLLGVEMTPDRFLDLRSMEAEALDTWAARK